MCPGGADAATHHRGDVIARPIAALVPVVESGQGIGDDLCRGRRRFEQPDQRHGDVLVAQLPEGLDHRGAQQFIHEQGNETRRNRRRSDPAQCLQSRERQEEVSLLRNGDERLTGLRRMKTAKRLDDVKSHVGVGIAQTCNQRRNRAPVTTFAKNQRRLGAKIRVSVSRENG